MIEDMDYKAEYHEQLEQLNREITFLKKELYYTNKVLVKHLKDTGENDVTYNSPK